MEGKASQDPSPVTRPTPTQKTTRNNIQTAYSNWPLVVLSLLPAKTRPKQHTKNKHTQDHKQDTAQDTHARTHNNNATSSSSSSLATSYK
mmetsp:Transcript_18941/g.52628  ORF Transcript_18941/g.52628 Transcript_18941/m.52628 type:complete len:90 (-) Transcript_18941:57-326(-)